MKTYYINDLDCAVCAKKIEDQLIKNPDVKECSISFMNKTLSIDTSLTEAELQKAVSAIEDVKLDLLRITKKTGSFCIIKLLISATLLLCGILLEDYKELSLISFGISFILAGYTIFYKAIKKGIKGDFFDENLLMIIASVSAICLGMYSEAIAVVLLYGIGEVFIDKAVGNAKKRIGDLIDQDAKYAFIEKTDGILKVEQDDIMINDILLVKPGDKIAADGLLLSDYAHLDMKSLTGESKIIRKQENDILLSGSIVMDSPIRIRVTKKASESTLANILALVEKAGDLKAKSEKYLTKFARVYTPIVTILALVMAFIVPLFSNYTIFSECVRIAIVFLVVACPCALVISIPLAYFVAIGSLSKSGILVKGSCYLDSILSIKTVLFDKTATLTTGEFEVLDTVTYIDKELFIKLSSSLENYSQHPIGKIIANCSNNKVVATNVVERRSLGIEGVIDGIKVKLGNKRFIPNNIPLSSNDSYVFVSVDDVIAGYFLIGDKVKDSAKAIVDYLTTDMKYETVILSGDSQKTVDEVGLYLGVSKRYGDLLPEDKYNYAANLRNQNIPFLYLGDGVNDTPALALADVAISFGQMGSDSAIEVSNIIFINDELVNIKTLFMKARKTRRIVNANMIFSLTIKFAVMILALAGYENIWAAVFADVGVSILAILNSIRLR